VEIVTIDFETFYDQDFSLSKLTTEQYVRGDLFQIIGMGIQVNNSKPMWVSGTAMVKKVLDNIDWSDKAILCHNTAFDGAILSWHFGVKPKLWLDTLSMARPTHQLTVGGSLKALSAYFSLGAKGTEVLDAKGKRLEDFTPQELKQYGEYCKNDVDLTYRLFKKLKEGFPISELMVIDQTIRMYTEPSIRLDKGLLETHLEEVKAKKRSLLADLAYNEFGIANVTDMLMSNSAFAEALVRLNVSPPTKISARTGKEAFAFSKTDQDFIDLLEHHDERVQNLVSARLGIKSTIEETRTERLIGVADRGYLPILLNYYGAHTGRFSGGDKLNLQNLPARGNTTIRRAICAPEDHVLISCDSSQIEARMVAWLAGQQDLVDAFSNKRDVYSEFASEVYGRTITKKDTVERFVGKTCILGLGYGMGAEKFRRTLEIGQAGVNVIITLEEAQRIVKLYRTKNHKIVELWNKMGNALGGIMARQSGVIAKCVTYDAEGIRLPNGFYIRYPALRKDVNNYSYIADARSFRALAKSRVLGKTVEKPEKEVKVNWVTVYGGKATENLVQAMARIVIADQMTVIGQKYHVAFQVHDEIIIVAPEATGLEAQQELERVMSTAPSWAPDLPVACESGMAKNYGET
jgi:DNA polymerase I-like protein with 3'-5' exonuclease and polymerase domains